MKVFFNKSKPKVSKYGKYKHFSNDALMHQLGKVYQVFPKFHL